MGMGMATENSNLSNASRPMKRAWVRPLARRVAATFIICALIFIGLSQVVVYRPTFRQVPDVPMDPPFRALPQGETRHVRIYFDTTTGEKFQTTPEVKPAPISPDNYKLHLDQ
jgi:hypothetical protein